jgi:hypothetical protein
MATAAVISLEETGQTFAKTRTRQQLHAQLNRWLDRLEAHMPEDTPSLEELTQAVFALRQELTGRITEALVAQRHAHVLHQRTLPCPHCQRLLPARSSPPRAVHTLVGEVSLARPYFYCTDCQQGFAPLDDALQLSERRTQWDLQQAAARLAAEVPARCKGSTNGHRCRSTGRCPMFPATSSRIGHTARSTDPRAPPP